MILVVGSSNVRPGGLEAALELSLEHVARSRREPGCFSHEVSFRPRSPRRRETPISVGEADCGRRYEVAGAELPSV